MQCDLGIGTCISREMALWTKGDKNDRSICDLFRSFEVVYWGIALFFALILICFSSSIATHWLYVEGKGHVILLMGCALLLQFPFMLYGQGLIGLQHQVVLNGIVSGFTLFRAGLILILLVKVEASIELFFMGQLISHFLQIVVSYGVLWRKLPKMRGRFRLHELKGVKGFALGVSMTTVLSMALTQCDRLFVSYLFPLKVFGYYSLAATLASALYYFVIPITCAYFPKFTELTEEKALGRCYHQSSSLLSMLVMPIAAVGILFSGEILHIWTRNIETASEVAPFFSLLCFGYLINVMVQLPYYLQLSFGKTDIFLKQNLISLLIYAPFIYVLLKVFGVMGAPYMWIALNVAHLVGGSRLVHKKHLPQEEKRWLREDFFIPLGLSFFIAFVSRLVFPSSKVLLLQGVWIGGTLCLAITVVGYFRHGKIKSYNDFNDVSPSKTS